MQKLLSTVAVVQVDFLGESTEGNLHLVSGASQEIVNVLGLTEPDDILSIPFEDLKDSQEVNTVHLKNAILYHHTFKRLSQYQRKPQRQ